MRSRENLAVKLRPALRASRDKTGEHLRLAARIVGPQVQLVEAELRRMCNQLVEPVARRVHLEPVTGARRDEGAAPAVLLDTKLHLGRACEHLLELVVVAGEPDVVDARYVPLPRLDDDVHAAALQLREA